ncbi:MAG: dethiobiotin synthase [Solirubrobacterales bacterium]
MGEGFFVTGTGTGVGKTVVAAVIARTWVRGELRVGAFKPAVSGLGEAGEADHELLRRAAASYQSDDEIAPYRYEPPVSPHLGAELAGEEIDRQRLLEVAARAARDADRLIAEGVGGLMVPLRRDYLVRDLISDLALPVVVVADPSLGTINHTLLTVEALEAVAAPIAALVLNPWPGEPGTVERSNHETLGELTGLPILTLPRIDLDDPDAWPALDPPNPLERLR